MGKTPGFRVIVFWLVAIEVLFRLEQDRTSEGCAIAFDAVGVLVSKEAFKRTQE